jgi:hypothetical protein
MVYQRLVPIPAHRLNRRAPQHGNLATEQRLTQLESDNATLVATSRRDNRLSHFIGIGALVVAIASAWVGYQFNTWQQNNATELAAAQNAQEMRQATQEAQSYSALLSMACVLQSQQAFAELQYRPQAASQIFDALKMMEPKCQAVGVSLTARAAWLVTKYPERLDRKILKRAALTLEALTPQERLKLASHDNSDGISSIGFNTRGIGPKVQRISLEELESSIGGHAYYLGRDKVDIPSTQGSQATGLRPSLFLDMGHPFAVSEQSKPSVPKTGAEF